MTREQQALIFAMWVADQVCREDFESESFPELACRRLYRLGIVKRKDGNWTFDPDEYELVDPNAYDEEETHYPCYVQVLRNSITGETSVGWWMDDEEDEEDA